MTKYALVSMFVLTLGFPGAAHHSAAEFDFTKTVEYDGVIKELRIMNPHSRATLNVTNAKGTHDLVLEGHSTNNFYRSGWREGMLKAGDKVRVFVNPRRDGAEGGFLKGFVTPSGTKIEFGKDPTSVQ